MLLAAALFWGLFLPWGRRFSMDALRTGGAPASNAYVGVPGAAWIGQICILYAFSVLVKSGSQWREEGTAIAYVLQAGQWNTSLAHVALGAPPWLLRVLTFGVLGLEALCPLALLLPWRQGVLRTVILVLLCAMHVGNRHHPGHRAVSVDQHRHAAGAVPAERLGVRRPPATAARAGRSIARQPPDHNHRPRVHPALPASTASPAGRSRRCARRRSSSCWPVTSSRCGPGGCRTLAWAPLVSVATEPVLESVRPPGRAGHLVARRERTAGRRSQRRSVSRRRAADLQRAGALVAPVSQPALGEVHGRARGLAHGALPAGLARPPLPPVERPARRRRTAAQRRDPVPRTPHPAG